jgi:ribosomal protein L11 methylase PrmA
LSGILDVQADGVLAAYRAGLSGVTIESEEDWVLIHGLRDGSHE